MLFQETWFVLRAGAAVEFDRTLFREAFRFDCTGAGLNVVEARPPEPGRSSEKIGAVRGEELYGPGSKLESEILDEESEIMSPLEYGLFLFNCSCNSGSIALSGLFCQPFWAL